ncbi:Reverse transcriptase (RNA-dependent DNA polymerase) [Popillia japonica]|uniref:Reverse transcriptase (RNA-dependent DNA polymerase) n=1 Tax=Popillia japonica TaxID=7064 RepID=A0AAW1JE20_POPJA
MQTFRYLGHFFGLSGAAKPTVDNLSRWLKCVEAAPLKPEQKLSLIREHVVPKLQPERIRRHNEIARKIAAHCRSKGWTVEEEPHIRHPLGHLYKPDIVIHREGLPSVVCDVQVSWDGYEPLDEAWRNKQRTYDHDLFRTAAGRRWPGKTFLHLPAILGARGIWPRYRREPQAALPPNISIRQKAQAVVAPKDLEQERTSSKRARLSSPLQQPPLKKKAPQVPRGIIKKDVTTAPTVDAQDDGSLKRKRLSPQTSPLQDAPPSMRPRLATVHGSPRRTTDAQDAAPLPFGQPRLSASTSDLPSIGRFQHVATANETLDEAFLAYLVSLRPTVDEHTRRLIGVGEYLSGIEETATTHTEDRKNSQREQRLVPPPPPTSRQRRARRASTYKKAQDLFQKDPSQLAEKIITGSPIVEEAIYPKIEDVDRLYRTIFERQDAPDPGPSRASTYKKAQDLFQKDPSQLAEKIITGSPIVEEAIYPKIEDVDRLYRTIFERQDAPDPGLSPAPKETANLYRPVGEEEIRSSVRNWSNSAPGPDGITIAQVKRCPTNLLEALFNIVLYRRMTPSTWKASRTKSRDVQPIFWKPCSTSTVTAWIRRTGAQSPSDPRSKGCSIVSWQRGSPPPLIGSTVQRLLHRVLAKRLTTTIELHPAQRGFREVDGTLANIIMLEHYIKLRRLKGKTYNIVSLDIRKAFDTVSHPAILRAMQRFGIDDGMQDFIMSTITDAYTNPRHPPRDAALWDRRWNAGFHHENGVKQGDPLSPVLFNIVLDELVTRLNDEQPGASMTPACKIASLAFADDLLLLEDRDIDVPNSLATTCAYFRTRGMTLNPEKCASILPAPTSGPEG